MTEFKQIIGRGTRVRDDYGKLYFNILDYTGAATRQFADPDFDGDPALVTKVDINDNGEEIRTVREELSQSVTTLEADQEPPLTGPISLVDAPTTTPRKYYIDDHPVEIAGTVIWDLDAEGRRLRMVKLTDYAGEKVRTIWRNPVHIALLSAVFAVIALILTMGQRLGEWRSKTIGRILGILGIFLIACWVYLACLWLTGIDLRRFAEESVVFWVLLGGLSLIGAVFAVRRNRSSGARPLQEDERRPLLSPVVMQYQAIEDPKGAIVLRTLLFVSNENGPENTQIYGFGVSLYRESPTEGGRYFGLPIGSQQLAGQPVTPNHPVQGWVEFKIDRAAMSDVIGRHFVVDVLGGEIVDGKRIQYSAPPQTIAAVSFLGPILSFGFVHAGDWASSQFRQSLVLDIKNSQKAMNNKSESTTARIKFICDDGSTFTITECSWISKRMSGTVTATGIVSHVDLEGGEEQPFVVFLVAQDGSVWVYKDLSNPVGTCGVGHWLADIHVTSNNAKPLQGVLGFTVLRGNMGIEWDKPAFHSRSDR